MTTTETPVSNAGNLTVRRSVRGPLYALVAGGILGVGLLAAALSVPGPVPLATTCTFATVGTTMTLAADCTTDATIPIPDGYTLDGDGFTITAVDPLGGHFLGAVVASAGTEAHVRNLRITTSGLADVCDGGAERLRGILFDGASGTITDNVVMNINQGASGCQEGNAIEARNAPFDGTHPSTKQLTIADNAVTGYQKTGILANGDVFVAVVGNIIVGAGPIPHIAQNGIQLGFGAMGEVRENDISGNAYSACSSRDAAQTGCIPWVSTGLLLYDVDANTVQHSGNRFRDNQRNLVLLTSESLAHP